MDDHFKRVSALLVLLAVGACGGVSRPDVTIRVESEHRPGMFPKISYYCNESYVGIGEQAVRTLEAMHLSRKDYVKVVLPRDDDLLSLCFMSSRVLARWIIAGADIQICNGDESLDIKHTVVLKGYDPLKAPEIEYVFDSENLGQDGHGLNKLREVPVEPGCTILVVYDYCLMPSSFGPSLMDDHPFYAILERWQATCRVLGVMDEYAAFHY